MATAPDPARPDRFEAWVRRLLVHACYAEARRRRTWATNVRILPVDGPAGPDALVSVEDRDQLDRVFRRLPIEQRAIFVLHGEVMTDRRLEFDPDAICECWARWPPDGQQLLFRHSYSLPTGQRLIEPMVAAANGRDGATAVGTVSPDDVDPRDRVGTQGWDGLPDSPTGIGFEWAPDGTSILAINLLDDSTWILNPAGNAETPADLGSDQAPTWQRLAP